MMTSTMKESTHLLSLIATAALLTSCGGNGPTPPNPNGSSFSATLAGAVNGSFTGNAVFTSAGVAGFGIVLATEATTGQNVTISFQRANSAPPGTGGYELLDHTDPDPDPEPTAEDFRAVVLLTGPSASGALLSTSGTLNITAVSGSQIDGTFQLTAVGPAPPGSQTPMQVTASGSFVATVTTPP